VSRNRKDAYVMSKLMYFLARFTPEQRADFLLRAAIEASQLPDPWARHSDVEVRVYPAAPQELGVPVSALVAARGAAPVTAPVAAWVAARVAAPAVGAARVAALQQRKERHLVVRGGGVV
jgi:hypothetical protein